MNAVVSAIQAPEPANLLEIISRASADPSTDVAKIEKLLELYERITAKNAEVVFSEAMAACQGEMRRISTDATNPQTRSQYATYGKLDSVLRPIYFKHGFSLSFSDGETQKPQHVRVVCLVRHKAGHKETHWKDMPADGKGAKGGDVMTLTHAAGAAQQYGMRYLLKGIFNVAIGEDDKDGNQPEKDVEFLSEKQVADLKALLTEVGADIPKFLRYLKVDSLESIYAKSYAAVVKLAESKRRQS
jgi:hypothetical protein